MSAPVVKGSILPPFSFSVSPGHPCGQKLVEPASEPSCLPLGSLNVLDILDELSWDVGFEDDILLRSQGTPLVTKFGRLPQNQYSYTNCSDKKSAPNLVQRSGATQASWVSMVQCTCLRGNWRGINTIS